MVRISRLLLGLLCLALVPAVFGSPRSTVEELATIINNNFYDPVKARDIASQLRKEAQAGAFDAIADPRDLASNLTRKLKPFDHHFNVTWSQSPAGPTAGSAASGIPPIASELQDRRTSYGFRSVEMLPGAIGYIDMRFFADFSFARPEEPARLAADSALQLVAGADAVIIDVRANGGGSPAMVGYLVSAFTAPGADIYNLFHRRDGTESERPAQPYLRPRLDVPLYVLISGRSASAAESLAYTLQAAKRATIVGERSAGAANPGGEFPLGDGFNVFVSTGTPVNPLTHANWEGAGVQPDIPVPAEQALQRAQIMALEGVLAKNPQGPGAIDTRWVLEALRAERASPGGPALSEYVGAYADATVSAVGAQLALRRGRQPQVALLRLTGDAFCVRAEPFRRVLFERDSTGKVKGFQFVRSSGQALWYPR